MTSESLHYDVVIVGAGPAGLATAIRLLQSAHHQERALSLCILEKASRIGGHQLSGALVESDALDLLFGDEAAPATPPPKLCSVTHATTELMTPSGTVKLPHPGRWSDQAAHIYSLGSLCRWLANHAESLGADIFPGFTASELLFEGNRVCGVRTGDSGRDADGKPGRRFEPGLQIHARATVLAEGCRGYLTQPLIKKLELDQARCPQTYGLGIKELWSVPESDPGVVRHTLGWPLSGQHGGGFLYQLPDNRIALGMVAGLDYRDPAFDPYNALQQWKHHPSIAPLLEGGELLSYGARCVTQGGWSALPRLTFDGGVLVGDSAGFLNPARLKGVRSALYSGILAAEALAPALAQDDLSRSSLHSYQQHWDHSPVAKTLHAERNVRPGFRRAGRWGGMALAALESLQREGSPWTLRWQTEDRHRLKPWPTKAPGPLSAAAAGVDNPLQRVDQALATSGLRYREGQPIHLQLKDEALPQREGARYGFPERLYCPARVYEVHEGEQSGEVIYRRHGGNCLQCKCCDIKDPFENIRWTPPEGGNGPDYRDM
uniref:Electron transfer flavoprotein-ubiquinone oxidoreductase n=1 Tax=Magnetococcus massalia (strain MO-1) TaxID=451514 RepID=A0A1S7LKZ6_MAGMO|nr:Electron transfer flavoprotein-ubiquinone oxidoreductase, mitochondrial [Candidatus Magnetococcus massalia]